MFTGPWNEQTQEYDPVIRVSAAEYRQDSGRERYMVRQRDAADPTLVLAGSERWTDYDGDELYGDYNMVVDPQTGQLQATATTAYLLGIGQMDAQSGEVRYFHGDQIGSLRAATSVSGNPPERQERRLVYTAFGEKVFDDAAGGPGDTRYQYGGEWGYEIDDGLPFMHVGHRYYDSSAGRFVQRDPIGIRGGLNAYEYVWSNPLATFDPTGLFCIEKAVIGGLIGAAAGGSKGSLAGACVWDAAGFIQSGYEEGDLERALTRIGSSQRRFCFVSGTEVTTSSGTVNVEDLKAGDEVLSRAVPDGKQGPYEGSSELISPARITRAECAVVRSWVAIELEHETLRCTAEHPFWVVGCGWTRATEIREGYELQSIDGSPVCVYGVRAESSVDGVAVHSISVDGPHTYYVGKAQVLVHNKQ